MERNDLEKLRARELAHLLALAEAERGYYQDVIAGLPVGLLALSTDLSIVSVNRSAREIFGLQGGDSFRCRFDGLMPASVVERVREVLATGNPQLGLLVFTDHNGGRHLRIGIQPIRHFGESEAEALLTIEDVTDLRRLGSARANSESPAGPELLDSLDAAVWVVEIPQMSFLFVNKAGQSLLGFDIEHWLGSGDFWKRRVHPADRDRVLQTYRAAAERPVVCGDRIACEYRAVTSRENTIWVREMARMLNDSDGRPRYFTGVTIDITQRHRLEQQLVQSNRMDAMNKLARRLVHDLNNLLMIVTGYGEELLGSFPDGSPLRGDVQQILTAGERVGVLTNQLLTFTRQQQASPATIDLGGTLRNIEPNLRKALGDHIELKVELGQHRIAVKADLTHLQQVIVAFARRARGGMPGGGQLSIGIKSTTITEDWRRPDAPLRPGEYAVIVIEDDGPQYDSEVRAALFESFLPGHEQDQHVAPMLWQAYALARQWGGDISVEAAPIKGEVFQIFLPLIAESIQVPVALVEPKAGARTEIVLVVDDEEGIRLLVGKILRRQGYKVLEAGDAQQAIELFRTHQGKVSLVIADVTMPGMDGPELVERLRKFQQEIQVLYISGYADDATLSLDELAPGEAFLRKPFTLGALQDKVKEMMAAREQVKWTR